MTPEVRRTLLEGIEVLEKLDLRYAIVGGLAVSTWAVPRSTKDVDLYAELPSVVQPKVKAELQARGFHVPAMTEELQKFGVFRSKLLIDDTFLDIFDAVGPLGETILERRKKLIVGGRPLWFVAPEDLALLKAFSDRDRDFDDLVTLFARLRGKLDMAYIERWTHALDESIGGNDVSERMQRARQQATERLSRR
jgi:predicted nucleotidyltransferase